MRLTKSIGLPALMAATLAFTGCYSHTHVTVVARDGLTKNPISGMIVAPDYPTRFLELFPPDLTPQVTDDHGRATVQVCINYKSGGAVLFFADDSRLLDQISPARSVEFSHDELLNYSKDPHPIDVFLLPISEYQLKYSPNPAG
jgi:hypothetical protein